MFVDVLGENVGDIRFLLLSLKDFLRKVVFVKVAGEDIHGFLAPQHAIHHTTWIHPVVEYQDGLLRFEHKAAMEDVGQRHFDKLGFTELQNSYIHLLYEK